MHDKGIVHKCDDRVESIYSPAFGKLTVGEVSFSDVSTPEVEGLMCSFTTYTTLKGRWHAIKVQVMNSSPLEVDRSWIHCHMKGEALLCEIHENVSWLWNDVLGIIRVGKNILPDGSKSLMCVEFDAIRCESDNRLVGYEAVNVSLKTNGSFSSKFLHFTRSATYIGSGTACLSGFTTREDVKILDYSTVDGPFQYRYPKSLKSGCPVSLLYYMVEFGNGPGYATVLFTTDDEIFNGIEEGPFHIEQNSDYDSEEDNNEKISINDNSHKSLNSPVLNTDLPEEPNEELTKLVEPLTRSFVEPYMEQIIALQKEMKEVQKEMLVLQRDIRNKLYDLHDYMIHLPVKSPDNTVSSVDNGSNTVNNNQEESFANKEELSSDNQNKISRQQSFRMEMEIAEWKSAKEAIDAQTSQIDDYLSRMIIGYKNDADEFIHTEKALKELFNELLICMDIGEYILATKNGSDLMAVISNYLCGVSPSMQQAQSTQTNSAPLSAQHIMKQLYRIDGFLDVVSRNCASFHETSKTYPYLRNFIENKL